MSKSEWRLWKNEVLKDCRYCMSDEVGIASEGLSDPKALFKIAYVKCLHCNARGPTHDNIDAAIIDWNGANE